MWDSEFLEELEEEVELDFQFSMWDSTAFRKVKIAPLTAIFQFSMWDSLMGWIEAARLGRLLSILYVRFELEAESAYLESEPFQFSMWDSIVKQGAKASLSFFQFSMWDSGLGWWAE